MSKNCLLYVVRHGYSEGNAQGILQGHADYPLTPEGIRAATALAKELKSIPFDAIFSSDLSRAHKTAEIIANEHQLAVTTTTLMREKSFGAYNGQKVEVYKRELKDLIASHDALNDAERFVHHLTDDIESDEETVARSLRFLREVAIAYRGKTVLIVSHTATMKTLLMHLGFMSYQEMHATRIHNLGYFVLESDGAEFFINSVHRIEKPMRNSI